MIKTIWTVRRKEGVSHEKLLDVWENVHAPHVRALVKPLHYHITFFDGSQGDPPYDGIAELWLRDRAHFDEFWGPQPHPNLGDDHFQDYIDRAGTRGFIADEYVQVDGPATGIKLTGFVKHGAGVDRSRLFEQWLTVHAPNVSRAIGKSEGVTRYVVSQATDPEAPYDGIAEIWGASPEAITQALARAEEDGFGGLVDRAAMLVCMGRELQIIT